MPVTAAQVQAAILSRTGDIDPTTGDPIVGSGGYLSTLMPAVWAQYADKAFIAPRLQELWVEYELFDRMLALIQDRYDFRDSDATFNRSQRVKTLVDRRDKVTEKIDNLVAMVAANRAGAVGQLTTTAAVSSPFPFGLDANNPRYSGSPYTRWPWSFP